MCTVIILQKNRFQSLSVLGNDAFFGKKSMSRILLSKFPDFRQSWKPPAACMSLFIILKLKNLMMENAKFYVEVEFQMFYPN